MFRYISNYLYKKISQDLEKRAHQNKNKPSTGTFYSIINSDSLSISSFTLNLMKEFKPSLNQLTTMLNIMDTYTRQGYSLNPFTAHRVILASMVLTFTKDKIRDIDDTYKSNNERIETHNERIFEKFAYTTESTPRVIRELYESLKSIAVVLSTGTVKKFLWPERPQSTPKSKPKLESKPDNSLYNNDYRQFPKLELEDSICLSSKKIILKFMQEMKADTSPTPSPRATPTYIPRNPALANLAKVIAHNYHTAHTKGAMHLLTRNNCVAITQSVPQPVVADIGEKSLAHPLQQLVVDIGERRTFSKVTYI